MHSYKKSQALTAVALLVPLLGGVAGCGEHQQAAQSVETDPKALVAAAERLEASHNLRGAEDKYQQAVKLAPKDESIHFKLARFYIKANAINAAAAELVPLKLTSMQSEEYHVLLAEVMARQGKAVELLRDIPPGSRSPEVESDIRTYRGLAELVLDHPDNAKQMIEDAERLNPKSVLAKLAKSRLLGRTDAVAADKELDAALELSPDDSRVLDAKGDLALSRHDESQAMQFFDKALVSNPSYVRALMHRGSLLLKQGKLDEAAKDAAATLRADAGNRNALFLQASIAERRGEYEKADAILTKLRGLMDRLPGSYLVAGVVKYHLNQDEQAETFLTRFIAQRQDEPEAYQTLGSIALKRGDAKRAVEMLQMATKLDSKNADTKGLLEKARAEIAKKAG